MQAKLATFSALSVLLAACGGGGGSATPTPETILTVPVGTGAALQGVTVKVRDAKGATVAGNAATDAKGVATVVVTGLEAPLVISASGQGPTGPVSYSSVLMEQPAAGSKPSANVTPLTTAVLALLSPNGDASDITSGTIKPTAAEVDKAVAAIRTVIAEIIKDAGLDATTFDPIKTPVELGSRTGADKVLDAVTVDIGRNGVNLSSRTDPNSTVATLTKATAVTNPVEPKPLPKPLVVNFGDFDFLKTKLDTCFTKPAATRATTSTPVDNVKTGEKDIVITTLDSACADIATTSYLSSSFDWKSKFAGIEERPGLWVDSAMDGATFNAPEILWFDTSDPNQPSLADVAVLRLSYKRKDGEIGNWIDVVRKNATTGTWELTGNQRKYDASVGQRVRRVLQLNPKVNGTGDFANGSPKNNDVSRYVNELRLSFNPARHADVRAVRIKGPGLPDAGVVLLRSSACGTATYMAISNITGTTSTSPTFLFSATKNTGNQIRLQSEAMDPAKPFRWPNTTANPALSITFTPSPMAAANLPKRRDRYTFEVFGNGSDTPVDTFTARITDTFMDMADIKAIGSWAEIDAAAKEYLTPGTAKAAAAQSSVTFSWTRSTASTQTFAMAYSSSRLVSTDTSNVTLQANAYPKSTATSATMSPADSPAGVKGAVACSAQTIAPLSGDPATYPRTYRELAVDGYTPKGARVWSAFTYSQEDQ